MCDIYGAFYKNIRTMYFDLTEARYSHMKKWPKHIAPLTAKQKEISDDFMKHWHEVLPNKFGIIEKFNQGFPVRNSKDFLTTLEIGGGWENIFCMKTFHQHKRETITQWMLGKI